VIEPAKLPRLSRFTASAGDLIDRLERHGDLQGASWKRLYVVALKRMATQKASHRLAQLCAVEAHSVAFHWSWFRDVDTEENAPFLRGGAWREARLAAIERRRVGARTLR